MMKLRLRQHGRRKGGLGGHGPLALVPMIDMMTIMVVYLLVHAADYQILPQTKEITIPQSISQAKPHETVLVMATSQAVFVNGAAVTTIDRLRDLPENVEPSLKAALERAAEGGVLARAKDAPREVTVMADKGLPYAVLRKVLATATAASYTKVSLAVVEKGRARGPN